MRFANLRGLRWRIDLGILPCSASASVEELRRVAADSRRRYASLRRRLLIDPHALKDGNKSPDLAKDNPLSQSPDSTWGRFFQNAELEKMVDQDLSRLYPEHSGYFQIPACQAVLRRILLLWCLRHPEYGYRQGMHELLAPLLYVLHVDLQHLSQVQEQHGKYFNDEFDETSRDQASNCRFPKGTDGNVGSDDEGSEESPSKVGNLDELDPDTRDLILLTDAYGAEGELGVMVSERFMEHDAYCMFDNLMNGAHGVVAMADFFSPSPASGSSTAVPPVIEASSALYHLLSYVDSSLYSHLVELGVEPQYFALRWLRVLFGREFSLDDLLVIWDELFSSSNNTCVEDHMDYSFKILCSPRGAFISAMAVSMLLHVRSQLFATENATSCLQRLLNFPKSIDVKNLIEKARSLQALALDIHIQPSSSHGSPTKNKPAHRRVQSLSSASASPQRPLFPIPESYWEEKWRVLHEEEELKKGSHSEKVSGGALKGLLVEKFGLSRTESDPFSAKSGKKAAQSSARRKLLDDLVQEVVSAADHSKQECLNDPHFSSNKEISLRPDIGVGKHFPDGPSYQNIIGRTSEVDSDVALSKPECDRDLDISQSNRSIDVGKHSPDEPACQNITVRTLDCTAEETCLSGENSTNLSTVTSPHSMGNDDENESEKSSVFSNSFIVENDEEIVHHVEEPCGNNCENSLKHSEAASADKLRPDMDVAVKPEVLSKERKPLSGKFQWFRKFGRGSGDANMEKGGSVESQITSTAGNVSKEAGRSTPDRNSSEESRRAEVGDKKVMGTMKNLRQSMLENIQVIESIFQQDRDHEGKILGGGQIAAMSALKELRKISDSLSEV